jgi:serine/threonine protein kinase
MGSVYLARYLGDCLVAVKLLGPAPEGTTERELRDRFDRECRVLMALRHPGIVQGYTHGSNPETGLRYLAMEYVEGSTASTLRRRLGRPLTPFECIDLLLPVIDALCYCHAERVYHRDISPQNILVAQHGGHRTAKLVDFGASWEPDQQKLTRGVIFGNLDFQPLERFQVDPHKDPDGMGVRTDVFAVAAVAHFLTAGTGGRGALLTTDEKIGAVPLQVDAPDAWRRIVSEALHPNPRLRTPSMEALKDQLVAFNRTRVDRAVPPAVVPWWMPDDETLDTCGPAPESLPRTETPIPPRSRTAEHIEALRASLRSWLARHVGERTRGVLITALAGLAVFVLGLLLGV